MGKFCASDQGGIILSEPGVYYVCYSLVVPQTTALNTRLQLYLNDRASRCGETEVVTTSASATNSFTGQCVIQTTTVCTELTLVTSAAISSPLTSTSSLVSMFVLRLA